MKFFKILSLILAFVLLFGIVYCSFGVAQETDTTDKQDPAADAKVSSRGWVILLSIVGILVLGFLAYYIYRMEDQPTAAIDFLSNAREIGEEAEYSEYSRFPVEQIQQYFYTIHGQHKYFYFRSLFFLFCKML